MLTLNQSNVNTILRQLINEAVAGPEEKAHFLVRVDAAAGNGILVVFHHNG
jgi:hypothetical protein